MTTTIDKISLRWKSASWLLRIVYINIAIFLVLRIGAVIAFFMGTDYSWIRFLECPSSLAILAKQPWSIITYMFAQFDVLHILFNMLWLYGFGRLFLEFNSQKQLLALYIYGGLLGAIVFMLGYNYLPAFDSHHGWLIGSSASAIAIVIATAILNPEQKVRLFLFGQISLKWIAIITLAIFFLGLSGENSGGHMAHFGGAIAGAIYGVMLRRGTDITRPFNKLLDFFVNTYTAIKEFKLSKFTRKSVPKAKKWNQTNTSTTNNNASAKASASPQDQAELDKILDKIKKSGYTALTSEEKQRLFDVSKRIK
ncbi:MAG: rhomboid family intramembrane serine protease [Muribaculaceae bacterium]|nr:rhomboid family intramembrane serine protease [Muribaculaceae bacterium]